MFGFFKKESHNNKLIAFDGETAYHGEHGRVIVSHKTKKYMGREIPFAFIGALRVPVLTLEIMTQIYTEAARQGYIVHEISYYESLAN